MGIAIGIGEEGIGFEGRDYNELSDPVVPHLRAIDGYTLRCRLKAGIRRGNNNRSYRSWLRKLVGGTFVAMKTYGRRVDDMIVKDPCAMKIAFGET